MGHRNFTNYIINKMNYWEQLISLILEIKKEAVVWTMPEKEDYISFFAEVTRGSDSFKTSALLDKDDNLETVIEKIGVVKHKVNKYKGLEL